MMATDNDDDDDDDDDDDEDDDDWSRSWVVTFYNVITQFLLHS